MNKDKDPQKSRKMLILGFVMLIPAGLVVALGPSEEKPVTEFEVSNLTVSPSEVQSGQTVAVSVDVKNTGENKKTETLKFSIDSETKTERVTLEPNQSKTVSFKLSKSEKGTYNVSISGMSESFEVVSPEELVSVKLAVSAKEFEATGERLVNLKVTLSNESERQIKVQELRYFTKLVIWGDPVARKFPDVSTVGPNSKELIGELTIREMPHNVRGAPRKVKVITNVGNFWTNVVEDYSYELVH